MVKIPDGIKQFIESQGIFVIGSVGGTNLPNVSPRVFFLVEEESIYWLDFFKHKSFQNFKANPWVTLAVFNKEELKGYQFRGKIIFITDEPTKSQVKEIIIKKTLVKNRSDKLEKISKKEAEVIQFEPKVCYSLDPEEFTDMCIGSDIDSTQLFQS